MVSRLVVPLLAAAVLAVASCGADEQERASASTDATALLRDTYGNLGELRSGNLDLSLRGGDSGQLHLRGPFAADEEGRMPKFALNATLRAEGQSVEAGATWTGDKGYVALQGTPYEVSPLLMGQVVAGYEESLKDSGGAFLLGGIDVTKWVRDPRNEGSARIGDVDTIKISGSADTARVLADLDTLVARAGTLSLPGMGAGMPKLGGQDRAEAAEAMKTMRISLYTGAEDRILRRLQVSGTVDKRPVALDVTFTDVGSDQTIAAPADAKPFSELLKLFDAAGFGGLEKALPSQSSGKAPNNVDRYAACIQEADGDRAKARKCAALLSGG
jgi:hypothetical protein